MEDEPRFQRKLLIRNIRRVMELVRPLATALQFIQSILSWQDPLRSSLAVIVSNILPNMIDMMCIFRSTMFCVYLLTFGLLF